MPKTRTSPTQSVKSPITKVYRSALKFLTPQSLTDTYATIVHEAVKLVGGTYGSIFIPVNGEMKRIYTTHESLKDIVARKNGRTTRVYKTGRPYLNRRGHIIKSHAAFKKFDVGSDISLPLRYNQETVGVLSVMSSNRKILSAEDLKTLTAFAPLATIAIQKSKHSEDLEKALQGRDLFVSIAAHELKTPLTALAGYIQVLLRQKEPQKSHLEKIKNETRRLTNLVNELFEVSKIKSGTLSVEIAEECNINDIIASVLEDLQYSYPTHTFTLKKDPDTLKKDLVIQGDSDKLVQVFTNIISNAAKYSPAKSEVEVRIRKTGKEIVVQVIDQGRGIAPQEIPHIFDQYFKANNSEKSGMGIGLFLVKEIIARHGGSISVSSVLDHGSIFLVRLPIT